MLNKFDENIVKIFFGFFCGLIAFGLVGNLVEKLFEKPDEQIAKEQCANMKKVAETYGGDLSPNFSMSGYINGKEYKCK